MKKDISAEIDKRAEWIEKILAESGAKGIVYGNSGGKDCTLVGALCRRACENVTGVVMPCNSSVNYTTDRDDALAAGKKFGIPQIEVDLSDVKNAFAGALHGALSAEDATESGVSAALVNINPRLRMTALYAIAQARGCLVAGTGNLCEYTMGYFTKWGDGAYDFNPIADLTVPEIYEMLEYLGAPEHIVSKAPSAGLYEGQTDEKEMGVTYAEITAYIRGESLPPDRRAAIAEREARTAHKRRPPARYGI